jgi:hypothetical protein
MRSCVILILIFVCRVKPKVAELYNLSSLEFESIFAGPPPQFGESQRKQAAVLSKTKKGQFTLDSWIKVENCLLRPRPALCFCFFPSPPPYQAGKCHVFLKFL